MQSWRCTIFLHIQNYKTPANADIFAFIPCTILFCYQRISKAEKLITARFLLNLVFSMLFFLFQCPESAFLQLNFLSVAVRQQRSQWLQQQEASETSVFPLCTLCSTLSKVGHIWERQWGKETSRPPCGCVRMNQQVGLHLQRWMQDNKPSTSLFTATFERKREALL